MDDKHFTAPGDGIDLHQLPVFAPGPGLWRRIELAQRGQVRMRRWKNGGFAVAAAVLAGVTLLLLPRPALPPQDMFAGQLESRSLESQWQQIADRAQAASLGTTHLRVIDAALQSAYDRRAQPDELAPLWQERNQALRGLIARFQGKGAHDALAVTHI